jgi:hypothetical protein
MNHYHQIVSKRQIHYHYKVNHKNSLDSKYIQRITLFYGTKSSPNAIIKNPMDGIPYVTENNETMTVGQYGKFFFRVTSPNTVNKEHNHLYYQDITDYLYHHNVILDDENIARKWNIKKINNENIRLSKKTDDTSTITEHYYSFSQPPWSSRT